VQFFKPPAAFCQDATAGRSKPRPCKKIKTGKIQKVIRADCGWIC